MSRRLHSRGLHEHDRSDLAARGGDFRIEQLTRRPPLPTQSAANRVSRPPRGLGCCRESGLRIESPSSPETRQFDAAEPRSARIVTATPSGSSAFRPKAQVLEIVALVLQFVLVDGQPKERRGSSVRGDQMQRERGLIVGVEVGRVHRHDDLTPYAHYPATHEPNKCQGTTPALPATGRPV